jgi:hypothetical protein
MDLNLQLSTRGRGRLWHGGFRNFTCPAARISHGCAILAQFLIGAIHCHYRRAIAPLVQTDGLQALATVRAGRFGPQKQGRHPGKRDARCFQVHFFTRLLLFTASSSSRQPCSTDGSRPGDRHMDSRNRRTASRKRSSRGGRATVRRDRVPGRAGLLPARWLD